MNSPTNTKLLYIVSWQRSGTTVLGDALGSMAQVFHTGELTYLFTPSHPAGNECGCGSQLDECPIWSAVLAKSGISWTARREANDARLASARMRHTPKASKSWKRHHRAPAYSQYLSRVYEALADTAEAKLIVDSSKSPSEGLAAIAAGQSEARILHMVRDPRACAYSTTKRLKRHGKQSGAQMKRKSAARSSARWLEVNLLAERYLKDSVPPDHYKQVRYEDLMADPHNTLSEVATWAGMDPATLPLLGENQIDLTPGHTVMGNPNRHRTGPISLTLDAEWVHSMSRGEKLLATMPALPLLKRYNYPLLPF